MKSSPRRATAPKAVAIEESIREPRVGRVLSVNADGSVQVDFPGNASGPVKARVSAQLDGAILKRAAKEQQGAVLLFEDGDPGRPIVLTLLASSSASPLVDALLATPPEPRPQEARVDGKRVVIQGSEEVVLRCGKASITLRRDGKVEVRGVKVLTEAEERQRIRGRDVQIN